MTETTKPVVTQASRQDRQDALAKALCLLDSFAGEGLGHVYGNGTSLDADDVCVELASAFGVEFEPGWYRKVAAHSPSEPSVVSQDLVEQIAPLVHGVLSKANVIAYLDMPHETPNDVARAILPLIEAAQIAARNDALDEAAKVADVRAKSAKAWKVHTAKDDPDWYRFDAAAQEGEAIARNIRALRNQGAGE